MKIQALELKKAIKMLIKVLKVWGIACTLSFFFMADKYLSFMLWELIILMTILGFLKALYLIQSIRYKYENMIEAIELIESTE